jgi:outer membrane receptor for ferrienterochelin and colicin
MPVCGIADIPIVCPDGFDQGIIIFLHTIMSTTRIITIIFLLLISSMTQAQMLIQGTVKDQDSHKVLQNANVRIYNTTTGTSTDEHGNFTLKSPIAKGQLLITLTGFSKIEIPFELTQNELNTGPIYLKQASIDLNEVKIIASMAEDRKTPVSTGNIDAKQISLATGDRSFPEVLRTISGIYATRTGGGSGDAAINIRGFKQENIALMLNGIPVGSVENGLVYWSNWDGLGNATQNIQIQKGFGASRIAANSVGGTINIITKTTETDKGGSLDLQMTDYGNVRQGFNYSTGKLKNGMTVTFVGSHTYGPGYIDATHVDAWSYLLTLGKQFNNRHKLVFTAMGSPERHGQRNFKLTQKEHELYGNTFNKDWGTYNGQMNNLSENFYHKPQISLNHYWTLSANSILSTSAYYSFGTGGGKWAENFSGNYVFNFRNAAGQIDWNAIAGENTQHTDYFLTSSGDTLRNFSKNAQTLFLASHFWAGLLSTLNHEISPNLKFTAGFHARYFRSKLWEEIADLLGGQYFIDDYGWAIEGRGDRTIRKYQGDKVRINNGATVGLTSAFTQIEYSKKAITALLIANASQNWYQRHDQYNYIENTSSKVVTKPGGEIKAGININLSENQNVYVNSGLASRAPYHKFVFPNYNNNPAGNIKNEKILTSEIGYGLLLNSFRFKINAYYTVWKDKSMLSNEYQLIDNNTKTRAMVNGLNAIHAGIETELSIKPDYRCEITLFGSVGNWKWQNNVDAVLFNNENIAIDTTHVYAKGLMVGDAPQTQMGATIKIKALNLIDLNLIYNYYDRFYADFDPAIRNNPDDVQQSFRLPSYSITDMQIGLPFELFNKNAYASINCSNIFDIDYIIRGDDGATHTMETFSGFWGFGRTFSFRLNIGM